MTLANHFGLEKYCAFDSTRMTLGALKCQGITDPNVELVETLLVFLVLSKKQNKSSFGSGLEIEYWNVSRKAFISSNLV